MIVITDLITVAANEPLRPVRAGIWKRVLVDAPTLGVDEIYFDAGIATDGHGHDLSQAAYQVSGRFEIQLGSSVVTLGPGDSYSIPAGVDHSVRCVEKGSYVLITARGGATSGDDAHDHDHDHDHAHDHDHGHTSHAHAGHGH
ncbi:MAG: cupin domain-containing protein [Chloroflexota bacterium]